MAYQVAAEEVAEKALTALPTTTERVALHSNPTGEHVFVDPDSRSFAGLIDFGDAYIGHPAFDLRPWRDPADRSAILAGYTKKVAVDADFVTTWRVALILGELAAILRMREPPVHAEKNIQQLLRELEMGEALP